MRNTGICARVRARTRIAAQRFIIFCNLCAVRLGPTADRRSGAPHCSPVASSIVVRVEHLKRYPSLHARHALKHRWERRCVVRCISTTRETQRPKVHQGIQVQRYYGRQFGTAVLRRSTGSEALEQRRAKHGTARPQRRRAHSEWSTGSGIPGTPTVGRATVYCSILWRKVLLRHSAAF